MTLSPTPRLFLKRTTIKAHGLKMKSCLFSLQQWFSFFQMSSDYKLGFLLLLSTFVFCHLFPKKKCWKCFKKKKLFVRFTSWRKNLAFDFETTFFFNDTKNSFVVSQNTVKSIYRIVIFLQTFNSTNYISKIR
jgi:hypothetical protein